MTRTVFLTHSAADSGAEQTTVSLLAEWPTDAPAPVLVLGEEGPISARAERAGVRTVVLPLDPRARTLRRAERGPLRVVGALLRLVRDVPRTARLLRELDAGAVVATSLKALVYGVPAARLARLPVVWSLHDRVSGDYFPRGLVPVLRHVVPRLVDGVVVNSRSTAETVRPRRRPSLVLTPSVPLDPRPFAAPGDAVRTVVVLGRLAPWKGQDLFLRAFAHAFGATTTRALVVGGALFGEDDFERRLRELALELGIDGQVSFTGHVDDPWSVLVDADVLVHCSRTPEPFGQVVVQGMWARCAVVATRPGGPAEVVTDGVDGLLVRCDDLTGLQGALVRLRDDADLRSRLAEAGRETAARYAAEQRGPVLNAWLADVARRRGR